MNRHKSQKKKNLNLEYSGKFDALDAFPTLELNEGINNIPDTEYTVEMDKSLQAQDEIRKRMNNRLNQALASCATDTQKKMYDMVFIQGKNMTQTAKELGLYYYSVNSALMGHTKGGGGLLFKVKTLLENDIPYQTYLKHLQIVANNISSSLVSEYLSDDEGEDAPFEKGKYIGRKRGPKIGYVCKITGRRTVRQPVPRKKSPYTGIYHNEKTDVWVARYKKTYIGTFDTPEIAKEKREIYIKAIDAEV